MRYRTVKLAWRNQLSEAEWTVHPVYRRRRCRVMNQYFVAHGRNGDITLTHVFSGYAAAIRLPSYARAARLARRITDLLGRRLATLTYE